MRRKISLYIADRKVDLSEDSLVLMNYTFEDLSNPTIVKNSYSKSISLAGTPNNNAIFGDIWRLDRVTDLSGASASGIGFNATKKTPFAIYNEMSEVLVSGYCKLDGIERKGTDITYKLNLYGGLGTFFYNLSYNEDGSRRTLADLTFRNMDGNNIAGRSINLGVGYGVVSNAWDYIAHPDTFVPEDISDTYYNIINFAPCYNGIPADFDANKAIVATNTFDNVPSSIESEGAIYTTKEGTASILLTFGKPNTEWEMCDLRWYLQRPVISIKAILNAIASSTNNGGYEVSLGSLASNPIYTKGWVTLPMIATADRHSSQFVTNLLKGTMSPADYLINICKMYGYVFVADTSLKRISIKKRSEFFTGAIEDMSGRIDASTIALNPNVADHRFYQLGGAKPVIGEWAKEYAKDFGREYGIQRINTGYEFDLETTELTKDTKLAEAVDVQEYSKGFVSTTPDAGTTLPQPSYQSVSAQYWMGTGKEAKSVEHPITKGAYVYLDNESYEYFDWLPKVQLHEADNKATKGENVLLLFNGIEYTPNFITDVGAFDKQYSITDDDQDMLTLNNGKPCWDLRGWRYGTSIQTITSLPSFRRISKKGIAIDVSLEYGEPLARATFGDNNPNNISIYNQYWKAYLTDRYDVDTKVMKCKADLRGMQVSQELLGKFFYYGGSLWVLNKIENYSLTTDDLTDCEFIKVKDKTNYTK